MHEWLSVILALAAIALSGAIGVQQLRQGREMARIARRQTELDEARLHEEFGPRIHMRPQSLHNPDEAGNRAYIVMAENRGVRAAFGVQLTLWHGDEHVSRSDQAWDLDPGGRDELFRLIVSSEVYEAVGSDDRGVASKLTLVAVDRAGREIGRRG
jgi:Flp pilus assembly protein TadB